MAEAKLTRSSLIWSVGTVIIALPVIIPILVVLSALVTGDGDIWAHLADTVLWGYISNTLALMVLVSVISLPLAVGTAWLTSIYHFPGCRWLPIAQVLPLAMPAYVAGYVYADLLDYTGPLQTWLRGAGIETALPPIRSLPGAALVISLVLYPYIYVLARLNFQKQSAALIDAALNLGSTRGQAFRRVALPLARPAVIGGLALVLMETIADYGVVEHYGVPTFTTGIFRTWFAMGEPDAALQLAGCLFLFAATLIIIEVRNREGSIAGPVGKAAQLKTIRLQGTRAWLATLACLIPVTLGFVLPVGRLLGLTIEDGDLIGADKLFSYATNTFTVALIAGLVCLFAATWLSYAERLSPTHFTRGAIRVATLGYAIPGMLLAVGLLRPLSSGDRFIAGIAMDEFDTRIGLVITGSIGALVIVYLARFLTVAYNTTQSGMLQIHHRYDDAARSLGEARSGVLRRVHLPLLTPSLVTALVLVFIDVLKELPATLILRPFNFETLATRVYRLASDERLAEASTAALLIIAIAVIPTIWLTRDQSRR